MSTRAKKSSLGSGTNIQSIVGSQGFSQKPLDLHNHGVKTGTLIWPQSVRQIAELVRLAHLEGAQIIPQGSASMAVSPKPNRPLFLLSLKRMQNLLRVDSSQLWAEAEAGILLSQLENQLHWHDLAPGWNEDDSRISTLGGTVAAPRELGPFGIGRKLASQILALEFVDGLGRIFETSCTDRPNLLPMLMGSRGTLGIITRIQFKIFAKQTEKQIIALRFSEFDHAIEALRRLSQSGLEPTQASLWETSALDWFSRTGALDLSLKGLALLPTPLHKYFKKPGGASLLIEHQAHTANLVQSTITVARKIATGLGGTLLSNPKTEYDRARKWIFFRTRLARQGLDVLTLPVFVHWHHFWNLHQTLLSRLQPLGLIFTHLPEVSAQGAALCYALIVPKVRVPFYQEKLREIWSEMATMLSASNQESRVYLWNKLKKALDPHDVLAPAPAFAFDSLGGWHV